VLHPASTWRAYFYGALLPYVHYVPLWRAAEDDVLPTLRWLKRHDRVARRIGATGTPHPHPHPNPNPQAAASRAITSRRAAASATGAAYCARTPSSRTASPRSPSGRAPSRSLG